MSQGNLSPWRAFRYFEAPRESYPLIGTGATVMIAPAEVRRVVLFIGLTDQARDLRIGTKANPGAGEFMSVLASQWPLILTQAEHGALCQVAWYVTNPSAPPTPVFVIEQLLRDWPVNRPAKDIYE